MGNDEKRQINSSIKISINAIITLIIAGVFLLLGLFALDRFDVGKDNSLSYWLQKGLTATATFAIMIAVANIVEEARKKRDKDLNDRVSSLDEHYKTLMENGETEDLEKLLLAINKKNKYEVYIAKCKKKYLYLVNHKPKKSKESYNYRLEKIKDKMLITPEEVFEDGFKVRYSKVTYSQMVSAEFDVASNEDDYDLQVHKTKFALKKLAWKMFTVVAFGGIVADFAFSYTEFNKGVLVSMLIKLAVMLISAYSGVCFGYFIVDRIKTVLRRKLRIFSQFRSREDNKALSPEEKWEMPIAEDKTIAKIRAERHLTACSATRTNASTEIEQVIDQEPKSLKMPHNALERAYDETFGGNKPVGVGGFIGKVLENSMEMSAQKNVEQLKNG